MMVVGDCIVFGRQANISIIHSLLESAGFTVGQHYEWYWYAECYAARFHDATNITSFLIQRDNHGET